MTNLWSSQTKMKKNLVLVFPQYQAGYVPSRIPLGGEDVRALWESHEEFAHVPIQDTDCSNPQVQGGIRFRQVLNRQRQDADNIIRKADPDFILTTGGDCGASFSSIAYLNEKYNGKVGVIWVDAHADIHLPSTSPSGNYHGMVLRNLLGSDEFDANPLRPLKPNQIAFLGLRDTEAAEDEYIAQHGIPRFSAAQVMGGDDPLKAVVAYFQRNDLEYLHLHVDCDVMDEKMFPFVHVPEANGLTLERLIEVLKYLRLSFPMIGCCVTEYAPIKSGDGVNVLKEIYQDGLGLALP